MINHRVYHSIELKIPRYSLDRRWLQENLNYMKNFKERNAILPIIVDLNLKEAFDYIE